MCHTQIWPRVVQSDWKLSGRAITQLCNQEVADPIPLDCQCWKTCLGCVHTLIETIVRWSNDTFHYLITVLMWTVINEGSAFSAFSAFNFPFRYEFLQHLLTRQRPYLLVRYRSQAERLTEYTNLSLIWPTGISISGTLCLVLSIKADFQ